MNTKKSFNWKADYAKIKKNLVFAGKMVKETNFG
jgi:hypothetical protein